jgi:Ca2+-binding RTX toxin-like protein
VTTLSAQRSKAAVGDTLLITAAVSNRSTTAKNVTVTFTFSGNVRVSGPIAGCTSTLPLVCHVDAIGATATISVQLDVVAAGAVVVGASARSDATDANVTDNDATLTIEAAPQPTVPPAPPHHPAKARVRTGTRGRDVLRGTSGRDTLRGLGGDDRLYGLAGPDLLVGGSGQDRLSGGAGADVLRAVDRQRDTVSCGTGRDLVYADRLDRVARDCERVIRRAAH